LFISFLFLHHLVLLLILYCLFSASFILLLSLCVFVFCFQFAEVDPAGDGTYDTTCNTECGTNLSTGTTMPGKCELKACSARTSNTTSGQKFPCGESACYQRLLSCNCVFDFGVNCAIGFSPFVCFLLLFASYCFAFVTLLLLF
jgi:hypothetical protein